mgnify:CR=1 FL=1
MPCPHLPLARAVKLLVDDGTLLVRERVAKAGHPVAGAAQVPCQEPPRLAHAKAQGHGDAVRDLSEQLAAQHIAAAHTCSPWRGREVETRRGGVGH